MVDLAKWLYVAMAVFSFPLMIAPAKHAISNLSPIHINNFTLTVLIIVSSLLLSLFIRNLSAVKCKYKTFYPLFFRFRLGLVYWRVFQFVTCYPDTSITATLTMILQAIKITRSILSLQLLCVHLG